MHVKRSVPALAAVAAAAAFAAPASADRITIGSDLSAPATIVEAHQADSAFWLTSARGASPAVPVDGQVVEVRIKGTVLKEKGAADPASLFHIQVLAPSADGSVTVRDPGGTSQGFDMPIDSPGIHSFKPENLCAKQGDLVGFNDIGGFHYGGSLDAPLDPAHYEQGAPFQIFGSVASSTTAFYTANDGTKNGATLTPAAGGAVKHGQELLMQVVLATGDDRSYECGGPYRRPDGTIPPTYVPTDPYVKLVAGQNPYVPKARTSRLGGYCSGPVACTGTMVIRYKGKKVATRKFSQPGKGSFFISFKVKKWAYKKLKRKGSKLPVKVTLTLDGGLKPVRAKMSLRR